MTKAYLYVLFFLSLKIFAQSPDDIITITADRIKSQSDKSTGSVRIFSSEEIQNSKSKTLPELLAKESDISLATSGPAGSNTSIFLRGADSSDTLVVMDGIVMNDPSNPNRQFDMGRLSLNNIEKIEILKGSQGLAYGSNAIGGVIVITSKKAKSIQATGDAFADYGRYQTTNAGFNFQKKYSLVNLSLGSEYFHTEGFSAADIKLNPGAKNNGSQRATFDLGITHDFSKLLTLDSIIRYVTSKADLDKGGGPGNDDPNDYQKDQELYAKIQLTQYWDEGGAETHFIFTHLKHDHLVEVLYDPVHNENSESKTWGEVNTISLNHTTNYSSKLIQNINIDWLVEKDQTHHSNQNASGFLYHQYELSECIFNFGIRLDDNKSFGNHLTYKTAVGYKNHQSLYKISYSTGFRAPSLNQLYDPIYGNSRLVPESSETTEFSHEITVNNLFKITSAFFNTRIINRLGYDPVTFINRNLGSNNFSGLEENIKIKWLSNFDQQLSFTKLFNHHLTRRPDLNIKNLFAYNIASKHSFDYEFSYVGTRDDVDNQGNKVIMPHYIISNFHYRFIMNKEKEIYLKIQNIFDLNYEEIYGYGTSGRAMTAGVHYNF